MNGFFEQLNTNLQDCPLLNAVNDGVIYENAVGRIVFANDRYCQMAGQRLSELLNQPSVDFIYPPDRDIYLNKTASRDHIKQEAYVIRMQSKNSRILETMVSVQAIFDEQNTHAGNLAVLTDITELQQQKRALEESETKYLTLLKASIEGIFIHRQGILLEANDRFFEMYGYEPHELIGCQVADILLTPMSSRIAKDHYQSETEGSVELIAVRKDGTPFPVLSTAHNITYRQRPVRIVSVLDLSPLRNRETELAAIQQRYRELARHSGTFLWEVDVNGLYTYVDPLVEHVIGYRPEELIGIKHFYDIHPQQDRDSFKDAAFEIFRNHQEIRGLDAPLETKDGNIVWVATFGIPQLTSDGSLLGYHGSDTDITQRMRTLQTIHDYQSQISHTERLAGLGTMVATICHEINQPLTALNLTLQELQHRLQKEEIPPEITEQYIQNCLDSVTSSISILHQFRKSSRLNDPLESKTVNLPELLENLRDVFKGHALKNRVRILLDPSIYQVAPFQSTCDLEQVLFILIHNAIDASSGPDAHEIRIFSESSDHRVTVRVSDQGIGIPAAHRDKIFDPFFTTKSRDKGTGLGLSIAKRKIDGCGGQIVCSSQSGKGTTFTVSLPVDLCIKGRQQ